MIVNTAIGSGITVADKQYIFRIGACRIQDNVYNQDNIHDIDRIIIIQICQSIVFFIQYNIYCQNDIQYIYDSVSIYITIRQLLGLEKNRRDYQPK